MPLIACPDCGHNISDLAATCIHCGRPLGAKSKSTTTPSAASAPATRGQPPADAHSNVVTVQQTSQTLKLQLVLATLAFLLGCTMWLTASTDDPTRIFGIAITAVGIVWYLLVKMNIWFRHA